MKRITMERKNSQWSLTLKFLFEIKFYFIVEVLELVYSTHKWKKYSNKLFMFTSFFDGYGNFT